MPLFGRRSAPAPLSEEEQQAAAADLDRIARGGIPVGAEDRLKRVAASDSAVFNSDLSAKEYAISQTAGLAPLAQVMGSSVVQHGWQNYGWASYGGGMSELPSFAAPWNLSRQRSFDRLRQEANFAGADAVIGIEMTAKAFLGEPGNVEYLVFGTAVRDMAFARAAGSGVRLCTLSAQDVIKLRRIGAETLDVIGHTAVVCVALNQRTNMMMGTWWGNTELTEVSRAVSAARHLAMDEVRRQAGVVGANEMVISTLTHNIDHHEYESPGYGRQNFFIVSMHVLGTAVALGAHDPHPQPLGVPMMTISLGA
jgi:uncharacterized protein YbjQ (UPF0145 family)